MKNEESINIPDEFLLNALFKDTSKYNIIKFNANDTVGSDIFGVMVNIVDISKNNNGMIFLKQNESNKLRRYMPTKPTKDYKVYDDAFRLFQKLIVPTTHKMPENVYGIYIPDSSRVITETVTLDCTDCTNHTKTHKYTVNINHPEQITIFLGETK